jgi:DNA-binding response OmpR family regulator
MITESGAGRCILIVDDEPLILMDFAECLVAEGYRVLEAHSGDAALNMLLAATGTIDLLVTDVNMPGELDGLALAARTRELFPDMPILIISARAVECEPPVEALTKPLHPRRLLAHIHSMIG